METKAFISYSWDNDEHTEWTNKIAHILRKNGINSLIDQIIVQPGCNLQNFMDQGINNSRWILCIISDGYISKMNNLTTGVGKEVELIKTKLKSDYVIPILKNNTLKLLPDIFNGKLYINFDGNDEIKELQKLVKRLLGYDREIEPIVSESPFSNEFSNSRIIEAEISKSTYINPSHKGVVDFDYSNNDGTYIIGSGDYEICTAWSKASNTTIYAYKDKLNGGKLAVAKNIEYIESFTSSEELDFTSRVRSVSIGDTVVWINSKGKMALTKILNIMDNTRNDPVDKLIFEYEILHKAK